MNKKAAEQQRAVRSMETPEQYSEFEDSVIEAAKTQAQRIIDDARRQGDANFDKLMEGHRGDPLIPYREEAKNRLARKMASVKQDNRKKLLVYRSQLVNGLFAEMEEALEEYTGTPAYAQRVADALNGGSDWVQLNPENTFVMQSLKEDWMRYAVPMVATCLAAFRRKA